MHHVCAITKYNSHQKVYSLNLIFISMKVRYIEKLVYISGLYISIYKDMKPEAFI